MKKVTILFIALLCASSVFAHNRGLYKRTRFNAAIGLSDHASAQANVSTTGNVVRTFGGGASTMLGIGMHIEDGLWGDFSMQMRGLEAETEIKSYNVTTHAVGVMPIMIGLRFYPLYENRTTFQPFVFLQGGPVIAAEEKNNAGTDVSVEAHTETTMGYQYGLGVNMLLMNWLSFDITGSYLQMNDLKTPINGAVEFNGWNLSFGFSLFWGRQ